MIGIDWESKQKNTSAGNHTSGPKCCSFIMNDTRDPEEPLQKFFAQAVFWESYFPWVIGLVFPLFP